MGIAKGIAICFHVIHFYTMFNIRIEMNWLINKFTNRISSISYRVDYKWLVRLIDSKLLHKLMLGKSSAV